MMVEPTKTRAITLLTTVLWIGCLGYLGTTPRLPDIGGLGLGHLASLGHYGTHLALAALIYLLSNAKSPTLPYRLRALGVAVVATTLIGGGIEVVQAFLPERTDEVSDLVFDVLGAITGATAVFLLDQYNVGRSFLSMTILALALTAIAVISVSAVVAPPRLPAVRDCGRPESSAFPRVLMQSSRLSIARSTDSDRVNKG